jgi:hypothetical protein
VKNSSEESERIIIQADIPTSSRRGIDASPALVSQAGLLLSALS